MRIDPLGQAGFVQAGSPPSPFTRAPEPPVAADGFTRSSAPGEALAQRPPCGVEAAAPAQTPAAKGRVFSLTASGAREIPLLPDGGILVDGETQTVAYFGDAAKRYLESTRRFDEETEVIIPSNGSVEVSVDGQSCSFSESGAVLLGAGAEARVAIESGDALVIRTKSPPPWYRKLEPEGEHKGNFDTLARMNRQLFTCHTLKSRFQPGELQKLIACGIVKGDDGAPDRVTWSAFKNEDEVKDALRAAGFGETSAEGVSTIWSQTVKRKLYGYSSGKSRNDAFSERQRGALIDAGAVKENRFDRSHVYWTQYITEDELRGKLAGSSLDKSEIEGIVGTWKENTRAGYDNTGLAWEKGKVAAYVLREKINMWNEQLTEWIVNSTAYAGDNDPFTVGVSNVAAKKVYEQAGSFNEIRPAETLHRHPVRDGRTQTEGYLVTGGKAALVSIRDGRPVLSILHPGDMAILEPGLVHCVLAVQGPYEHVCFQVPSAFQYGFLFKDEQSFDRYGIDKEALVKLACAELDRGTRGEVPVTPAG